MTTLRRLDERSSNYISTLSETDDLAVANRLIDEAVSLQDEGRAEEAEGLLTLAAAHLEAAA